MSIRGGLGSDPLGLTALEAFLVPSKAGNFIQSLGSSQDLLKAFPEGSALEFWGCCAPAVTSELLPWGQLQGLVWAQPNQLRPCQIPMDQPR